MRISSNSIMVRPTLIVGLGGTGVLICRWVEQYIRDLLGYVPSFIRFLKLDTDALEEGGPTNAGQSDFFNLFHYMDAGEVVRDTASHPELHPHLDWLHGFPLDASFADYGCQGIPRLGRLVFAELRETVIHEAVAARFSDLRSSTQKITGDNNGQFQVAPDGAPAVHLASSVCGGTGAGMLIDMAYNLRWWSRESFPRAAEIIGHLVLPEAFTVDPMLRPKLDAVAGAMLEQIEFLTDSRREDVSVRYREEGRVCIDRLTAPFNFVYLLNGRGDTGSGNRKHLVRMIARAIQAMTIEPTGQHVTSDANNKLNDILGLIDPACGRRQCFASYGLWYGTPGHRQADVHSWICRAVEAMCAGSAAGQADYAEEVQRQLRNQLDVSAKVDAIGPPAEPFTWDVPSRETAAKIEANVRTHFQKYLNNTAAPHIRAEAGKILPPDRPHDELLQAGNRMIEDDVWRGRAKPFSQVGVGLNQWTEQLDSWMRNEHASPPPDLNAVGRKLIEEARHSLRVLASRIEPVAWTQEDVVPVIEAALDRHWRALVEAVLCDNRARAVEQTLEVFRRRKQALDALASVVRNERVSEEGGGEVTEARVSDDFFSTPLYTASDPTVDSDGTLSRQFRQQLIRPLLRGVVLDIATADEELADVELIKQKLDRVLADTQQERDRFLKKAESDNHGAFHSRLPKNSAAPDHLYYGPVCGVLRLAAPNIDLERTGVFAKTLEVGISQHVPMTCVPDLLAYNVGATYREANVTDAFEKRTRVWFQLLRLRYGFCLEAISTYKRYFEATDSYVVRRGFTYSDAWLDNRWYNAYQATRELWANAGKAAAPDQTATNRETYDAVAADIHQFCAMLRHFLDICEDAIRQEVREPEQVFHNTKCLIESRGSIEDLMRSMSPSAPEGANKAADGCVNAFQVLMNRIHEITPELPQAVLARLAKIEVHPKRGRYVNRLSPFWADLETERSSK